MTTSANLCAGSHPDDAEPYALYAASRCRCPIRSRRNGSGSTKRYESQRPLVVEAVELVALNIGDPVGRRRRITIEGAAVARDHFSPSRPVSSSPSLQQMRRNDVCTVLRLRGGIFTASLAGTKFPSQPQIPCFPPRPLKRSRRKFRIAADGRCTKFGAKRTMNLSFGINYEPSSLLWDDIRKGPSLDAVREHLDRVVNFGRYSATGNARKSALRR